MCKGQGPLRPTVRGTPTRGSRVRRRLSLGRLLQRAQQLGLVETVAAADSDDWASLVESVTADVRGQLFDEQLALLDDPATWIAASCGRQAGKNFTVARLLVLVALERTGASCVYVNATYAEARRIMWADAFDGIPAVLRALGLVRNRDYWLNETRLEVTFANDGRIELMGADRGAWEKLRGNKIDLIAVDECQKLEDDGFRNALDKVLPDTLVSRKGRCVLIGTPDEFCVGEFHDICTRASHPEFSVHHWDASQNDRRPDIWNEMLRWKSERGLADDDPVWQREKLGLWVRQDDSLMLPLTELGLWSGKYPELIPSKGGVLVRRSRPMEHYMGLDFGWTDSAAIVVGSISREEGILREVHSWKSPGLDTDGLANVIKAVYTKYGVRRIYADAADPKTIADLSRKWKLPVVAVEKHNKATWIRHMQAKARLGQFQVLRDSELHEELKTLSPDQTKLRQKKLESPPGAEDHCWDAGRYLFRGVYESEVIHAPQAPQSDMERREAEVERWKDDRIRRNRDARNVRR